MCVVDGISSSFCSLRLHLSPHISILFTNGLNDGWSALSILEDLSDSLPVINFPNGAHHSDLSHEGPSEQDTDDLKAGFVRVAEILGGWLDEIKEEA